MMYHHFSLLMQQLLAILQKDSILGIEKYDEGELQALIMVDEISKAIIKQFPAIFT